VLLTGCAASPPPTIPAPKPSITTAKTVFIGDSITRFWSQTPEFRAHSNWISKDHNGWPSPMIAQQFESEVIALHPDVVHILAGTNDVYPWWISPCEVNTSQIPTWWTGLPNFGMDDCSTIGYMVSTAQANGIRVILGTIPPWGPGYLSDGADPSPDRYARIAALNAWIRSFAATHDVTLIDYHSILTTLDEDHYVSELTIDGVHPSDEGLQKMTDLLFEKQ
jgi:lysophospholipase L1-like esterase